MAKKRVKLGRKRASRADINTALIENFVKLQQVMANLSIKFDGLSDQISKLLQLFEIAAKSFVKKQEDGTSEDRDLLKKLDTMLEQNKTIAKGLTLIEEKVRHKIGGPDVPEFGSGSVHQPHALSEAEIHGIYPEHLNLGAGGRPRPRF